MSEQAIYVKKFGVERLSDWPTGNKLLQVRLLVPQTIAAYKRFRASVFSEQLWQELLQWQKVYDLETLEEKDGMAIFVYHAMEMPHDYMAPGERAGLKSIEVPIPPEFKLLRTGHPKTFDINGGGTGHARRDPAFHYSSDRFLFHEDNETLAASVLRWFAQSEGTMPIAELEEYWKNWEKYYGLHRQR